MQEPQYVPGELKIVHPRCRECGVPMWLSRIEPHKADHDKRTFECKACGASVTEVVKYK